MQRTAKEREVLQLLRNYLPYRAAYGGAPAVDEAETMSTVSYGPAGYIAPGVAFEPAHRWLLGESIEKLEKALVVLMRRDFPAYFVLLEPYLRDPGDSSIVDRWRQLSLISDDAAAKVAHHDRAIRLLAETLREEDLYPVFPKILSEVEERRIEDTNREMVAFYQRLMRAGLSARAAAEQAASEYEVGVDTIERVLSVRDALRREICEHEDCTRSVFSQGLCQKHYRRRWRLRRTAS